MNLPTPPRLVLFHVHVSVLSMENSCSMSFQGRSDWSLVLAEARSPVKVMDSTAFRLSLRVGLSGLRKAVYHGRGISKLHRDVAVVGPFGRP